MTKCRVHSRTGLCLSKFQGNKICSQKFSSFFSDSTLRAVVVYSRPTTSQIAQLNLYILYVRQLRKSDVAKVTQTVNLGPQHSSNYFLYHATFPSYIGLGLPTLYIITRICHSNNHLSPTLELQKNGNIFLLSDAMLLNEVEHQINEDVVAKLS